MRIGGGLIWECSKNCASGLKVIPLEMKSPGCTARAIKSLLNCITMTNLKDVQPLDKLFTTSQGDINEYLKTIFKTNHDFRRPSIESIGPDQAEKLLSLNTKNRSIRRSHVLWLSKQMELGYWVFTGQVIGFSRSGILINFQHTLHAIIDSGTTQRFIVLCGLDENAIHVMDTGIARTAGDVLTMNGIPSGNALAATLRKIMASENNKVITVSGKGQLRGASGNKYTSKDSDLISNTTILDRVSENKEYWITHVRESQSFYAAFPVISASDYGFYYHKFKQKDSDLAWEFLSKFTTSVGMKSGSPILALRQRFEKEILSKLEHSAREKSYWIRYCWNKFRAGENVKVINKYDPNEPLPDIE